VRTSKNNGSTSSKGRKIKIIKYHQEKIWKHGSDGSDGFIVATAARATKIQRAQKAVRWRVTRVFFLIIYSS
jgi:hypothetical protein